MAKIIRHHSVLERIGLFIGGLVFGYATLLALSNNDGGGWSQIAIGLFGLCSFGGFYGAFVGKKSI